jgi:hypothetical protein
MTGNFFKKGGRGKIKKRVVEKKKGKKAEKTAPLGGA